MAFGGFFARSAYEFVKGDPQRMAAFAIDQVPSAVLWPRKHERCDVPIPSRGGAARQRRKTALRRHRIPDLDHFSMLLPARPH
jgi:hypothetical protein